MRFGGSKSSTSSWAAKGPGPTTRSAPGPFGSGLPRRARRAGPTPAQRGQAAGPGEAAKTGPRGSGKRRTTSISCMERILSLLFEQPAARDEVHLETDPVRVLEEHRVVAGRPRAGLGRLHDVCADLAGEGVRGVDVLAGARAEADVVEPDAALVEALAGVLRRGGAQAEGRPPADAVVEALRVEDRLHAEEGQELRVEVPGAGEVARGDEEVRDRVDLHVADGNAVEPRAQVLRREALAVPGLAGQQVAALLAQHPGERARLAGGGPDHDLAALVELSLEAVERGERGGVDAGVEGPGRVRTRGRRDPGVLGPPHQAAGEVLEQGRLGGEAPAGDGLDELGELERAVGEDPARRHRGVPLRIGQTGPRSPSAKRSTSKAPIASATAFVTRSQRAQPPNAPTPKPARRRKSQITRGAHQRSCARPRIRVK